MFEPIKKTARYLRREQYGRSIAGSIGFFVGAAIGTVLTGGAAAPLFVIPLVAGGASGFAMLIEGGDWDRVRDNTLDLNGCRLVGDKKDLTSIKFAQRMIDKRTATLKHLPELPPKLHKKLLAHIGDVQGALSRVRVYKSYSSSGETLNTFTFHRDYINVAGREEAQAIAVCRFVPAVAGQPAKSIMLGNDAPPKKPAPQPDPLAASFTDLSRKVDDVAQRVDRIENPPEIRFDKPKLRPK